MDGDLDATAGLPSLASDKGKPRTSWKAAAPKPKPKKVLTAEQRAKESAKRKDRRHVAGVRDEAIVAAVVQQQVTNARVTEAMREVLCMLGLNPSLHGLVNASMAAAVSTDSSAFPRALLPDSPRASSCNPVPDFHVYPQVSRLSGKCSPEVGVGLDLDGFPLDHEFPEDYGLEEEDECDIEAEPLFEDELGNQADGTAPKRKSKWTMAYTAAEDKLLYECWRDIGQDPKTGAEQKHSTLWIRVHCEFHERKNFPPYQIASARGWVSISKRCMVIQQECNKFCATLESVKTLPVSGIGVQDMCWRHSRLQPLHCFRVIKYGEKFKAQYTGLKSRGGKQAMEVVGDGEKARPRGTTNSKKEDKRDAASIALIATMEGMITKKDSREEKRRQERDE
ncbi:Lectin-domain containing receptor kinase A4.3 [Hordeum vulgare]|nr:Lectin-domain containing receptor kinase A4.3 [Hordeum vulgare]